MSKKEYDEKNCMRKSTNKGMVNVCETCEFFLPRIFARPTDNTHTSHKFIWHMLGIFYYIT